VQRMVLALDLDTSPGVMKFSVINLNTSTFDADAYTAVLGQNATQPASLSPDALVTTAVATALPTDADASSEDSDGGTTITIVVVAVLVIIAALLVVVASKAKILCWAERFASFQGTSFSNPMFRQGGPGGSASSGHADDGELYSDMAGAAGASERGASMVNETYAGMGVVEDGRGASMGYTCVFGNGNDSEDDDTDI